MRLALSRRIVQYLCAVVLLGVGLFTIAPDITPAYGEEAWNPFADVEERQPRHRKRAFRRRPATPDRAPVAPVTGRDAAVDSVDLAPLPPLPGTAPSNYERPGQTGPAPNGWSGRPPAAPERERAGYEQPSYREPAGIPPPRGRRSGRAREEMPDYWSNPPRGGQSRADRGWTVYAPVNRTVPANVHQGLSGDVWRGVSMASLETLLKGLAVPPRSPALHELWRRMWLSSRAPAPSRNDHGETGLVHYDALRLEALYRSGLVADVVRALEHHPDRSNPLLAMVHARALIGLGQRQAACRIAKRAVKPNAVPVRQLKGQALLVMGYCAAAANNAAAAELAVTLAREEGVRSPLALAVMEAVANGTKPRLDVPDRMTLIDLRFLQLASSSDPSGTFDNAEPAVFGGLSADEKTRPELRLKAAERAARINALTEHELADVYRAQAFNRADIADPLPTRSSPAKRRALLFQAVEQTRDPRLKARFIEELYRLARRDGLQFPVSRLLLLPLADLRVDQAAGFSQTAVEIAVTGGDYSLARRWVKGNSRGDLEHWLALIDIADPHASARYDAPLGILTELAQRGVFKPDDLHRLATVLDALEYNIPIPLWEAASRSPQPNKGYLPRTGILPRLAAASSRGERAHTILLSLHTIGAKGARGAHMLALGDTIKALRRAGLKKEARRLGFEALIDGWPRSAVRN